MPSGLSELEQVLGEISRGYVESIFSAPRPWVSGQQLRSPRVRTEMPDIPSRAPEVGTSGNEGYLLLRREWELDRVPGSLRARSQQFFSTYRLMMLHLYSSAGVGGSPGEYLGTRVKLYGVERSRNTLSGSQEAAVTLPGAPLLSWPDSRGGTAAGGDANQPNSPGFVLETLLLLELHYSSPGWLELFSENLYDSSFGFLSQTRWENGRIREFSLARDSGRGFREIIRDEHRDILSLRRYDDGGRLEFRDSLDSRVEVRYTSEGQRIEEERFPGGGSEIRRYQDNNLLLSSTRLYPDGREEERIFSYSDAGDILSERYEGPLGMLETRYRYNGGDLSEVISTRDGSIIRRVEYEENGRTETRYVRGNAVLRVYFEGERRMYEEELVNGQVVRRREYGEASGDEGND